jgi:hypothetical protein
MIARRRVDVADPNVRARELMRDAGALGRVLSDEVCVVVVMRRRAARISVDTCGLKLARDL